MRLRFHFYGFRYRRPHTLACRFPASLSPNNPVGVVFQTVVFFYHRMRVIQKLRDTGRAISRSLARLATGCAVIGVVACWVSPAFGSAIEQASGLTPARTSHARTSHGLTADVYRYSPNGDLVPGVTRVLMSEHGIKITEIRGPEGTAVNDFIHNFTSDQVWLDSRQRKVYVELSVVDSPLPTEKLTASPRFTDSGPVSSALLTGIPCVGLTPTFHSLVVWRGIEVERWHCRYASSVIIQYFDATSAMVVREVYPDGGAAEVTDYREIAIDPDSFFPDSQHEAVEPEEFFHGFSPLSPFEERI